MSKHAHARLRRVDADQLEKLPPTTAAANRNGNHDAQSDFLPNPEEIEPNTAVAPNRNDVAQLDHVPIPDEIEPQPVINARSAQVPGQIQTAPRQATPAEAILVQESQPPPLSTNMPSLKTIFCTRVPLVKHTLKRVRQDIRDVFAKTVWAAANSDPNTAMTRWTAVFLFPAAILALPPPTGPGTDRSASATNIIRDRLLRWVRGGYSELWSEAAKRATFNDTAHSSSEEQARINLRRATRLAKEGAYSKATMALQSNGVASPNGEVREELLKKHPQQVPYTDGDHALPHASPHYLRRNASPL